MKQYERTLISATIRMTCSSDPLDQSDRSACGDPTVGLDDPGMTDSSDGDDDAESTAAVEDALAIPTLADRVRSGSVHDRELAACGLGVAAATRDPQALPEVLLEGIEAPPDDHSASAVARIVADTAEADVLPVRALVQALTISSAPTEGHGRCTRLRDDAGALSATLLRALALASDPGDATSTAAVRADIRDALASSSEHPPDTLVTAVDTLASLPTTAIAQNEE